MVNDFAWQPGLDSARRAYEHRKRSSRNGGGFVKAKGSDAHCGYGFKASLTASLASLRFSFRSPTCSCSLPSAWFFSPFACCSVLPTSFAGLFLNLAAQVFCCALDLIFVHRELLTNG
jgi:hypothetical protein